MSDPGTTYRTREEIQRIRSTQDPIRGLQRYISEWGLASEDDLKAMDKEAKAEVDVAVEEAKASHYIKMAEEARLSLKDQALKVPVWEKRKKTFRFVFIHHL